MLMFGCICRPQELHRWWDRERVIKESKADLEGGW